MRKMAFLLFFSIVILIYGIVNYYVFKRGLQALPTEVGLKITYTILFWTLAASFFVGRFLERLWQNSVSELLIWTGSFWLGALLYFLMLVIFFDLLRLINYFFPFLSGFAKTNLAQFKQYLMLGSIAFVVLIVFVGHLNSRKPRIKTLEITIPKTSPGMQSINAAIISDIHLGTIIGNGRLASIVKKVNSLNPDIILMPGDILDEDLAPVIRQNTGEILKQLSAPLGVFGVMGNHEYIGGPEKANAYLSEHGIQMLRDQSLKIKNSFYLIGREDYQKNRFTGSERKPIEELIGEINTELPVIVMDHQPVQLEKTARAGADLMLSGHTHGGQIWPFNFIVNAIFKIGYGLGEIEGMKVYVSNGVGTWGPPMRIGNRPEIVNMKIRFEAIY